MATFTNHPEFDPIKSTLIACTKTGTVPVFMYKNSAGHFFLYRPGQKASIETIAEQEAKLRYSSFNEKKLSYALAFPDRETLNLQLMIIKEIEAASRALSPGSSIEDLVKIIQLQSKLLRLNFEHLKTLERSDFV